MVCFNNSVKLLLAGISPPSNKSDSTASSNSFAIRLDKLRRRRGKGSNKVARLPQQRKVSLPRTQLHLVQPPSPSSRTPSSSAIDAPPAAPYAHPSDSEGSLSRRSTSSYPRLSVSASLSQPSDSEASSTSSSSSTSASSSSSRQSLPESYSEEVFPSDLKASPPSSRNTRTRTRRSRKACRSLSAITRAFSRSSSSSSSAVQQSSRVGAKMGRKCQSSPSLTTLGEEQVRYEDLEVLDVLGSGGFGRVELVRDRQTDNVYALKSISKQRLANAENKSIISYLFNEKEIMEESDSEFHVRLYQTFNLDDRVCFLMEPVLGGDLFWHMQLPEFSMRAVVFYAACVVLALEDLHRRNVVFRDLKPENVVMGTDGYVKLIDFGFARKLKSPNGRRHSLVGTLAYAPPEVLSKSPRGHGMGCDRWMCGVMIYELIARRTPFESSFKYRMIRNIQNGELQFPEGFSSRAADLCRKLLQPHDLDRISFDEIKQHALFVDIDWAALRAHTVTPPYMPKLARQAGSTRYFGNQFDPQAMRRPFDCPPYSGSQKPFRGF